MQRLIRRIEADPVFQATASPYLIVDRNLMMRAMNPAYLAATERDRDELLDQYIFDVFPDNPTLPDADGVQNLNASLETVLRSNRRHLMRIQRYDIPAPTDHQDFVLKYWSPVNSPVRDERGHAVGVLVHVEDVTKATEATRSLRDTHSDREPLPSGRVDEAAQAKMLVHVEHVLTEAGVELAQLRTALSSRVLIERAKGVIMAQHGHDPDTAFAWLRKQARDSRTPLHDVCAAVISHAHPHTPSGSDTHGTKGHPPRGNTGLD
jgi:two-component system, response regulator / RNA-binding antiterminator